MKPLKCYDPIPGASRRSLYLTMRDGVRIAIDVWLPAVAARAPTVLHQTRYFRRVKVRPPLDRLAAVRAIFDDVQDTRRRFVDAGYCWIDVCVRGSGASFGTRPYPWAAAEIADGAEIVDWIIAQPWSNGLVGATGISYGGTTADFLLVNRHPAVRAIAPRFSLFDCYTDIAFPGGIQLAWFTRNWGVLNGALDANHLARATGFVLRVSARGWSRANDRTARQRLLGRLVDTPLTDALSQLLVPMLTPGVGAVDDDPGRKAVASAARVHRDNYDVHAGALGTTFRDDSDISPMDPDGTIDTFSPHTYADDLRASGAAIFSYSGWLDGAYQRSAIHRFLNIDNPGSQLVIGGWDHGGGQDVSPFNDAYRSDYDHDAELLAFFDRHLKPEAPPSDAKAGAKATARVRYFTLGEERWKEAETWPPPGFEVATWHLGGSAALEPEGGRRSPPGSDPYQVDTTLGSGDRARWNSLVGSQAPIGYGDLRTWCERLLTYTSRPLPEATEVTGHPLVHLWLSSSARDATAFVYLLDVAPSGYVRYVTEGQLRALHRRLEPTWAPYRSLSPPRSYRRQDARPLVAGEPVELVLDLLPVSWRFAEGHSIRLAIAGADRDHFAVLTPEDTTYRIHRGSTRPSRLDLPVRRASDG